MLALGAKLISIWDMSLRGEKDTVPGAVKGVRRCKWALSNDADGNVRLVMAKVPSYTAYA